MHAPICRLLLSALLSAAGCANCLGWRGKYADPPLSAVRNFGVVDEGKLYRGARPTAEAIAQLRQHRQIKTIVNIAAADDDCQAICQPDPVTGRPLNYFHFPSDAGDKNSEQLRDFLKVATTSEYQPVFLHCDRGADRTGEFVAAYEIVYLHRDWKEVDAEMDRHLFCPLYGGLKRYVRELNPTELAGEVAEWPVPKPTICGGN